MSNEQPDLISYREVLEQIEDQENHLLLGNGFNKGLGVNTGYPAIFEKMMESNQGLYKEAKPLFVENKYDLESFIGSLENDIAENNEFLRKYVNNKVKFDFMKATHEIVKSKIKNVYVEKNEGIYILLKNFDNYFTLNYDSFLYLLLLKYKKPEQEIEALAFQPTLSFIEDDMNQELNGIYQTIKHARSEGKLELKIDDENIIITKDLRMITKTHFLNEIKEILNAKNIKFTTKGIEKVVKIIFEEEKRNECLKNVDDGSRQMSIFDDDYIFNIDIRTQNLFFLHGAFHIFKDGKIEKKITKETNKALYDKLENILNDEEKEIVCIFQAENKLDAINESAYLTNNLEKLETLSGNMVIIGSSLAENDSHILERINNSHIDTLYISTTPNSEERTRRRAQNHFPLKNIYIFNAKSISYELPDEEKTGEQ
jgi:Domain of unknown function (DUF4917)